MKCIEMDYKKEKAKLKRMIPNTYEILKNYNCYIAGEKDRALLKCEIQISNLDRLELKGDIKVKELKVLDIQDLPNEKNIEDILPF